MSKRIIIAACGMLLAAMLSGCAMESEGNAVIGDVLPGHVRLIQMRTTPAWQFWDHPSKAWAVNENGVVHFIPVDSKPTDVLSDLSGPLEGLTSHVAVAVPAS